MQIRDWIHTDQSAITALVTSIEAHGHDVTGAERHGGQPDPTHRSRVAWDRDGLQGVGTLWEHPVHPARWRVTVHGSEVFWSGGGATMMLHDLQALRTDHRPLQTAFSAREVSRCAFWQQQGFSLLMRTRGGVIDSRPLPQSVLEDLMVATDQVIAAGYRLASLTELGGYERCWLNLARLHAAVYTQGHQWNPVRPLTDAETRDLFLDPDEVMPDSMILALQGEDLVAVASLRRTADAAEVELGWTGVLPDYAAHREELIHALVGRCLDHAAGANWRVMIEVDEVDAILWKLTEQLPLRWEPDWLTFAKDS